MNFLNFLTFNLPQSGKFHPRPRARISHGLKPYFTFAAGKNFTANTAGAVFAHSPMSGKRRKVSPAPMTMMTSPSKVLCLR